MQLLDDLRRGTEGFLTTVSEGWQKLMDRSQRALTRFRHKETDATKGVPVVRESWGLLASEIYENDREVVARIEAPGLDAQDIDLQVLGDHLVVRGEKRYGPVEERRGSYYLFEAAYGSFERALPLPAEVLADGARASYERGVLEVRLPKRKAVETRRIPIK